MGIRAGRGRGRGELPKAVDQEGAGDAEHVAASCVG